MPPGMTPVRRPVDLHPSTYETEQAVWRWSARMLFDLAKTLIDSVYRHTFAWRKDLKKWELRFPFTGGLA